MVAVYRAPMRSRHDAIDSGDTIARARRESRCGFGRAVRNAGEQERLAARVARFARVADGSFVWTRDPDELFWLGRISGPYFYDDDQDAEAVDLVHVRPCQWRAEPLREPQVPLGVIATFRRGGRNFQQTHHPSVSQETERIWDAPVDRR